MHLTSQRLFKLASLLVGVTLIGVTLVGAMLIFFNMNRASIYNELVTLDLIPRPEKLTELYFNNHATLLSSVTSNQVISFAFVIHNLETTDYQYAYNVSVKANSTKYIIDSGNILVKNNQYAVKHEKFKLTNSSGSQEVVVELTNKRQAIDFWIRR
jgi:hypothetical protein